MEKVNWKKILSEKEFWGLLLVGIGYFYRPLFLGETFFFRDLYLHFLLRKQLLADFIHSGQLPLWNVYLHGGQPYWGDLSNSILYPANLLYVFLPALRAFNLTIVLHFLGCLTFPYIFLRIVGFQPIASLIAGVIYGFCGYTLSLGNLLGLLLSMPYLPLLFLGWHLFLLEGRRRWFIITVICGVFQVFAGAPEMNVLSLLSLLGWTVCFPYSHLSRPRRFLLWGILGLFIAGLSSVQLIPTLEMIRHATRGQGIVYSAFSQWSLHPKRLAEIIFPGFLGYLDRFPWDIHYWGKHLVDLNYPYILSIYFGGVTLVLACLAGKKYPTTTHPLLPLNVRRFLLSFWGLSIILAMGRFLPFFHTLYQYFLPIRLFRYPIKFLIAGVFPVALLAGYTVEEHFGDSGTRGKHPDSSALQYIPSRFMVAGGWMVAVIFCLFTVFFRVSETFAKQVQEFFFGQVNRDIARSSLNDTFVHATAFWVLLTLLYQYRRLRRKAWQSWLLVAILTVDLLVAGKRVNPYAPEEFFTTIPPVVQTIHHEIGGGRLFRTENPAPVDIRQGLSDHIMWGDRWNLEVLGFYVAVLYRIPVIFHVDYDRLAQIYVMNLKSLLESLPWERRIPLLSAGNVTLMLTSEKIVTPGVEFIGEVFNRSDTLFYLYRNTTAANRVEFVRRWSVATSDHEALTAMLQPNYDPRQQVVLYYPAVSEAPVPHPQSISDPEIPKPDCEPIRMHERARTPYSLQLSVATSCEGYLVFSDPFYPGWYVSIDGQLSPILRANYAFSAVFLQAGEHDVQKYYRPNSLIFGALVSLGSCVILSIIIYKGWL